MEYEITNGILTARMGSRGAQLLSLTLGGVEYVWPGGDAWGWSAPVCCPWCGAVEGGEFVHAGRRYAAARHGFVRDCEHELASRSAGQLTFALTIGEGDARWPWPFELTARFKLDADTLMLTYTLSNEGKEKMPLQLGFHPGFIAPAGSVIRAEKADMPDGTDALAIVPGLFDGGSIDLAGPASAWFRLERPDGHCVTVVTEGYPYVLLWGASGETPFACIEPWSGYPGSGGMFDRPGVTALAPGETFSRTLKIALS